MAIRVPADMWELLRAHLRRRDLTSYDQRCYGYGAGLTRFQMRGNSCRRSRRVVDYPWSTNARFVTCHARGPEQTC